MQHILEETVLFNGVIVRTFWMTLVKVSEHDQKIPHSHTADQPTAP